MNIKLTQAELCKAVQFYLNGSVLKEDVEVTSIKKDDSSNITSSVLHVEIETRELLDEETIKPA